MTGAWGGEVDKQTREKQGDLSLPCRILLQNPPVLFIMAPNNGSENVELGNGFWFLIES